MRCFIHVRKAIVIQGAGMKGKRIALRMLSFAALMLCLFFCGAAWQAEAGGPYVLNLSRQPSLLQGTAVIMGAVFGAAL